MMIQGDREIFAEDIEHIQLIVKRFPSLSRKEIVHTLCETLPWLTPAGRPKVNACTKLLHRLEAQGSIRLPAKREQYSHRTPTGVSTPVVSSRTVAQPLLNRSLNALGPVRLVPVSDPADQALWNEYVERYHYLGYKRPFGYRQRYFIEAEAHRLGCVLLSGAAKALNARDHWIGWDERQRMKNLPWVLNNNRLLLFPWVRFRTWPATCWGSWRGAPAMIGSNAGVIAPCCSRPLSMHGVSRAAVTAPPAGNRSGAPPARDWSVRGKRIKRAPS